jgi:hypothetical protein
LGDLIAAASISLMVSSDGCTPSCDAIVGT